MVYWNSRGAKVVRLSSRGRLLLLFISVSAWTGCGGPSVSTGPIKLDPDAAAEQAMQLYDTNKDGKLDAEELAQCPALSGAIKRIDTDRNKSLSAPEIAARLRQYDSQADFVACSVVVSWKNRPLEGADVTFEPEPFMGDRYPAYQGKTDSTGSVSLRSEPDTPGLPLGFFRVRISKMENGTETLPEKFNTKTTLGREVAEDFGSANRIAINLK